MALSEDEDITFRRLSSALSKAQRPLERLDAYYEGVHRLERLGLAVPPELERFVTTVNWPRITVDSVEQRCDVTGFQLRGQDAGDDELWGIWQDNGLEEESQLAHLDSMALTRSYVCVGTRSPDDPDPAIPLVTVESPFEVIHESDPRTRRTSAGLRRTRLLSGTDMVTLYLPDETVWLERQGSRGWVDVERDEHRLGHPLVVPMPNRSRPRNRMGVSEMADVIPLTDAACRALTNAQVATEVMAIPQRYVLGAAPTDFVDQHGKPLTTWETYFGAVWALVSGDAKVGQFTAADLSNFETIVNHYANLVSGVSGLPTRFYGQYTTNPPSEGSIVADEMRLIMNTYRKHGWLGGVWRFVMRLVRRIIDGEWDPALARMKTLWRNPETPTRAQTADGAVKLKQAGITTRRQARRDVGYSPMEIANMELDDEAEQLADPLSRAADAFRIPPPAPVEPTLTGAG